MKEWFVVRTVPCMVRQVWGGAGGGGPLDLFPLSQKICWECGTCFSSVAVKIQQKFFVEATGLNMSNVGWIKCVSINAWVLGQGRLHTWV